MHLWNANEFITQLNKILHPEYPILAPRIIHGHVVKLVFIAHSLQVVSFFNDSSLAVYLSK